MRPFVDFYRDNGISPVSQDISDLEKHFSRRDALYRHLGLPAGLISGKRVLEFGPGSGHNSLFTAHCDPSRYLLIDGNPVGVKNIQTLLTGHVSQKTKLEVRESFFEDFQSEERFDLVLAEGFLPWQRDPAGLLRHLAGFVDRNGVLVITTSDPISSLSEILRRIMGAMLVEPADSVQVQLDKLLPVFEPHLETLSGMSRPYADWILDNIIQPVVGKWFAIPEAISAVEAEFDIYGSSPHFLADWRWYKDVHGTQRGYNQLAVEAYQSNLHNFLNFHEHFPPRPASDNEKLKNLSYQVWEIERAYQANRHCEHLDVLCELVQRLAEEVAAFSLETADALGEFSNGVKEFLNRGQLPKMRYFPGLFGRGQQYLSFIRRG